jgi:hypothetical protein
MKPLFLYLLVASLAVGISSYAEDEKPAKKTKKAKAEKAAKGEKGDAARKGKGKAAKGKAANVEAVGTLSTKEGPEGKTIFVIETESGMINLNPDLSARIQTAIDKKADGAAKDGKKPKKGKGDKEKKAKEKKKDKKGKAKEDPAEDIPDF